MIRLFFKGGLINIIGLLFGLVTSPVVIRALSEEDSKEYIRLFAYIGFLSLGTISINNHAVLRSSEGKSVFNEIFIIQSLLALVCIAISVLTGFSTNLLFSLLLILTCVSVEWLLQYKLKTNVIIRAKFYGRLFLFLALIVSYISFQNLYLNYFLGIYLLSLLIEQVIYWNKVKYFIMFNLDTTQILRTSLEILPTVPFYLMHGQIINVYLIASYKSDLFSAELFYLRLGYVIMSFITSMTYLTMPYFSTFDDSTGFRRGWILTLAMSILTCWSLYLFLPLIESYYLNGSEVPTSMKMLVFLILIVIPQVNYYVVNKLVVSGSQNRMIPIYIVSFIPWLFFNYGVLSFYYAFTCSILVLMILFIILLGFESSIFHRKFR